MKTSYFPSLFSLLLTLGAPTPAFSQSLPPDFKGITYAGYRAGQSPLTQTFPSTAEVAEDMQLLKARTPRIRTYSALEGGNDVPAIAAAIGLEVMAGAWISGSLRDDLKEIDAVLAKATANPAITSLIIGNEPLLRDDLPPERLQAYLAFVRARTALPVSVAEPWGVWMAHPEMADHVDFIAAHILPYWENVAAEDAVDYAFSRIALLRHRFPGKRIVITETGWPSDGETRGLSEAGLAHQQAYYRDFAARARAEGVDYLIIEGFDQPWKAVHEGRVGAHWGIFTAQRILKTELKAERISLR